MKCVYSIAVNFIAITNQMASDEAPASKRSKVTRDGRLDGKVVFVTAAAQGIGRASALVSDMWSIIFYGIYVHVYVLGLQTFHIT